MIIRIREGSKKMPTINQIRRKYSEDQAIQCACDFYPNGEHTIAMRVRAPEKVLGVLMWNRGIHMILSGSVVQYSRRGPRSDDSWKDVIQMTLDSDVFTEEGYLVVEGAWETANGVILRFPTPQTKRQSALLRKKLLRARRKFREYESWGGSVLTPHIA